MLTDARRRAADPRTAVAELTRLARHRDPRVRDLVAGNPNTDRAVLMSLALTRADLVAANPVLDWWLLEDPNWLSDVEVRARHRLLASPSLRNGTRWWAARFGTDDDAAAVLRSAATTADVARYLVDEGDAATSELAEDHVSLRSGHRPTAKADGSVVGELAGDTDEVHDLLALARPATWALDALDLSSLDVRRALAAHAGTSRRMLQRLLLDDDGRVAALAARHPSADEELRTFATRVRADDPTLRADELDDVLDSPVGLRCASTHPNLRVATRDRLVRHESWQTRRAVAANPTLRDEQFEALAIDNDRDVRAALAGNERIPALLLRALRNDRDDQVRAAAARNPGRPHSPNEELDAAQIEQRLATGGLALARVAVQPMLALPLQRQLATSEDWRVRHLLASNATTSPAVLRLLASDPDLDVRRAVVRHPSTPTAAVVVMAADVVTEVRAEVASRTASGTVLRRLATDPDGDVRARVAANPATTARVVTALLDDGDERVRLALARRPVLPPTALARLAPDPSDDLRVAVVAHPSATDEVLAVALGNPSRSTPDPVLPGLDGEPTGRRVAAEVAGDAVLVDTFRRLQAAPGDVDDAALDALLGRAPWTATTLVAAPLLSTAMAARFAVSTQWRVREALAKRADLRDLLGADADAIVRTLVADPDYDTRAAIAANPLTPDDCIDVLSADSHRSVRLALVQRPTLPPTATDRLGVDDEDDIRAIFATRSDLHPSNAAVVRALVERTPTDPTSFEDLLASGWARHLVARHPSSEAALLERLAGDSRWEVREAVAEHPATPTTVLDALAADSDRDVRRAVAANDRTTSAVIEQLCSDGDRTVARAALANPTRASTSRALAARRAIAAALRSPSTASRVLALSCPDVDAAVLRRRRHWSSSDWRERLAVARHPATPTDVLRALSDDGLQRVRLAAAANLRHRNDAGTSHG